MTLHVDEPTRITDHSKTCLDQIISNVPNFLHDIRILPPISNCDHCVVGANLLFRRKKEPAYERHVWEYDKADFNTFRNYLNGVNWDSCFSDDIDSCCNHWSDLFLKAAEHCIPNKKIQVRPSDQPWYNSQLRLLKRQVKRKYETAKSLNYETGAWTAFCQLRNYYQERLKSAEEEYNNKLRADLKNPHRKNKCWWRTVKYFLNRNHSSTVPSLLHDDKHISDNHTKAEIFNSFFLQQCNLDTSSATLPEIANPVSPGLDFINVTEEEVLETLLTLDTTKASRTDEISPKLLKEAAPAISSSLAKLFNYPLDKKEIPCSLEKSKCLSPSQEGGR